MGRLSDRQWICKNKLLASYAKDRNRMSRIFALTMSLIVSSILASAASAQEACPPDASFSQRFHYDYYRNKMWPLPFRAMDTRAVLSHFEVQRNNGWKLNNTIGTAMFNTETQRLTGAGKEHLRWIVTRAPQDRRVVFVLQGNDQAATAARVESTQLAISELVPVGPLPPLYLTDRDAPGSSGAYQTAIYRALQTSVPAPRLQSGGAAGGGAGGGTP